jgi:polyketide cyclase/dehydrase/lipid transport protein
LRAETIDVRVRSAADRATTFAVVRDRSAWPSFTSLKAFELEQPGVEEPHGHGSIGRLQGGPLKPREQIVECIPNRRISYVLLSGIPVRDYQGEVDFERGSDGTSIHWQVSFMPSIPGTGPLLRRLLRGAISDLVAALAAEADRRAIS